MDTAWYVDVQTEKIKLNSTNVMDSQFVNLSEFNINDALQLNVQTFLSCFDGRKQLV